MHSRKTHRRRKLYMGAKGDAQVRKVRGGYVAEHKSGFGGWLRVGGVHTNRSDAVTAARKAADG